METESKSASLAPETVAQLRYILEKTFEIGQHWVRSVPITDWRRLRYTERRARRAAGGPPTAHVVDDIRPVLGYLEKAASATTGAAQSYLIVKADSGCLKENGIALLRPVLKLNFDDEAQVNFHIWFHCIPAADDSDHLMAGWRLESPEGGSSTHDYFHAQPLRDFQGAPYGLHPRFPERFPTFPLPVADPVELCLTAVLVACGKERLRELVLDRRNPEVRAAANRFWTKLFGNPTGSAPLAGSNRQRSAV